MKCSIILFNKNRGLFSSSNFKTANIDRFIHCIEHGNGGIFGKTMYGDLWSSNLSGGFIEVYFVGISSICIDTFNLIVRVGCCQLMIVKTYWAQPLSLFLIFDAAGCFGPQKIILMYEIFLSTFSVVFLQWRARLKNLADEFSEWVNFGEKSSAIHVKNSAPPGQNDNGTEIFLWTSIWCSYGPILKTYSRMTEPIRCRWNEWKDLLIQSPVSRRIRRPLSAKSYFWFNEPIGHIGVFT